MAEKGYGVESFWRPVLMVLAAAFLFFSCGEDVKPNRVGLEQLEMDGSTNDRYLFREELEKERESKKPSRKKENF